MTDKVVGFKAPENFRNMLKGMESLTMENSRETIMFLIWNGAAVYIIDRARLIADSAYEKITQFYTSTLSDKNLYSKLYNLAYFMLRDKANFPASMGPTGEISELDDDFLKRKNQYDFLKTEYPVNEKRLAKHFSGEEKLVQEELSRMMLEKTIWETIRDNVYLQESLDREKKHLAEIKKEMKKKGYRIDPDTTPNK